MKEMSRKRSKDTKSEAQKTKFPRVLQPVCSVMAVVLLGVFFSAMRPGLAGKQEAVQWSVESHDRTNFPLVGKHRTVSCKECHLDGVFEGTPTACEVCHWERRQDDRYELRLGAHCADCHQPFTWKHVPPNKWNHESATGYPLEGVHRTLDCVECHGERGGFLGASVDCFLCHENVYRESVDPDHIAAGFSSECQICHFNNNSWEGALFSHESFPLTGQHTVARCSDCHRSGQYAGLPPDCVFCHQEDYNATQEPNHQDSGFPTACELCHGTNAITWEGAIFTHSLFPLSGKHRLADCSDCHSSGQYDGLPSDCVFCHRDDYNSTRDPDHMQLNYPLDCEACHGVQAITWEGGAFNHDSFPLKGQHAVIECSDCHTSGQYEGLPTVCVFCHLEDYLNAKDPDHKQLGFHTDCDVCHGTDAATWRNAKITGHAFPIESGKHSQGDCRDCHISADYRDFSCLNCHSHDRSRMDKTHRHIPGYSFNSRSCYACHLHGRK